MQDQELMFGWRSDVDTSRYLAGAAPASLEQQLKWFEGVRANTAYSYHIVELDEQPVGFTSMFNADPARRDAEWGLVIGTQRTPGDVRVIAPLCLFCVFQFAELEMVYVSVNEDNGGAIRRVQQMSAVPSEGPGAYRKDGEVLMSISAGRFNDTLLTLIEGNPALADILDAEMHIVEPVA